MALVGFKPSKKNDWIFILKGSFLHTIKNGFARLWSTWNSHSLVVEVLNGTHTWEDWGSFL